MTTTEQEAKRIETERLRLVALHNEQTKLSATYANGCAIALFAVGGLTPSLASFAPAMSTVVSVSTSSNITIICVSMSLALHVVGRLLLRGMKS